MADEFFSEVVDLCKRFEINKYRKVRLGKHGDGGYVVPAELVGLFSDCVTFGVDCDISFEQSLYELNNDISFHFYDGTVCGLPPSTIRIAEFSKTMISPDNINDAFSGIQSDSVLFKCDIEGSEYGSVERLLCENVDKISCIVIEVHWITNTAYREKFLSLISFIRDKFTLFHMHANNCGTSVKYGGGAIPDVIELTYVSNRIINEKTASMERLPLRGIDEKNRQDVADIDMALFI